MARVGSNRRKKTIKYFDYTLLFLVILLICFGMVMLYSSSSYDAQQTFGDPFYYLKKQAGATAVGLVAMIGFIAFDYRKWKNFAWVAWWLAVGVNLAVIFIGQEYNNSRRWLKIGPISFQPSEAAKLAVIVFLATMICQHAKQMKQFRYVMALVIWTAPIWGLVAYSNLSTGIIIIAIVGVMLFAASPKYLYFFLLIGLAAVAMTAFVFAGGYRVERFQIWLDPEAYEKGFQTLQGLYAIGSGGLFGKGLGNSIQKLGFIPEAQNDMIFSIICEELGLFGAICVILLFLLIIWRFMIVATNAPDLFGSMLVTGVMVHIAVQVILNIAVVTNTIPNTGVTLPFISYGGTSIVFLMAEMGLVLSVSRKISFEPEEEEKEHD